MLNLPPESRKRLDEVREEIRKLAELPPEARDYGYWQRLVEEERRLMDLLAESPSEKADSGQDGSGLRP